MSSKDSGFPQRRLKMKVSVIRLSVKGRCKLLSELLEERLLESIKVKATLIFYVVCSGEFRNAFVCVRPPGHHAGTDGLLTTASSCGFCVFNNVMIAAFHAFEKFPEIIKKIAIVDIGKICRVFKTRYSSWEWN